MDLSFRITGIRLVEAHFAINHQYKQKDNQAIDIKYGIEINYKQMDKVVHVLLAVSSDYDNQPFRFSVAWEGSFSFEEMPLKDTLERTIHINCASIIFPYIRETIADLTRRAALLPFNLPPFNFVALYEERQKAASQVPPRKTRKKIKI